MPIAWSLLIYYDNTKFFVEYFSGRSRWRDQCRPIASLIPFIQLKMLNHRRKSIRRLLTNFLSSQVLRLIRVFDMENWFIRCDESVKTRAIVILNTLFVDLKIDDSESLVDNCTAVLETDCHTEVMRFRGEKVDIVDCICLGQTKPVIIIIGIDIIRIHGIAGFIFRKL